MLPCCDGGLVEPPAQHGANGLENALSSTLIPHQYKSIVVLIDDSTEKRCFQNNVPSYARDFPVQNGIYGYQSSGKVVFSVES
jgi:hypothetical protein